MIRIGYVSPIYRYRVEKISPINKTGDKNKEEKNKQDKPKQMVKTKSKFDIRV